MRKLLFLVILCSAITSHAQREFWGTASSGGDYDHGFIYKTDLNGDNLEIVHHFKMEVDGKDISALTLASNNKLYGMAASGGTIGGTNVFSGGTFFEYDLATSTFRVVQHFGATSEALPGIVMPLGSGQVALTEVTPGILYGVMRQGSYVFSYNISTGVFAQPFAVPMYSGGATNGPLQNKLNRSFIKAADGNFYVTTATNSVCPIPNPYLGSIMRMNAAGSAITVRYRASCSADDGYVFKSPMLELNGKFFGVTDYGGTNNTGVIFEYTIATNTYLKRYDLTSMFSYAVQALALAANGKIYGVAHGGGIPEPNLGLQAGGGVLFEFDPATGAFEVKHNFMIAGQSIYDMGVFPTSLITGTNGKLYGATQYGVFEYDPVTSAIRTAGRFNGLGFAPSIREVCRKPYYTARAQHTFTICAGESFTLDLESPNATSVEWKHNNVTDASQTTSTLQFDEFHPDDAGTWSSTLTNVCGTTVTQTITLVAGDPEKPVIEANSSTEICAGEQVTLSAPEGFASYHWLSGETSRSIDVTESGSYSVVVNNGCESDPSDPVEVVVNALPETPTLEQQYNNGVMLVASGSSSGNYRWTLNNETLDVTGDRITDAQPGVYKVYSVSDANCESAEGALLNLVITGNEPSVDNAVRVFPNPASELLTIRWSSPGSAKAEVYNTVGKHVATVTQGSANESLVDLKHVPPGIYFILIRTGTSAIVRKIQVKK